MSAVPHDQAPRREPPAPLLAFQRAYPERTVAAQSGDWHYRQTMSEGVALVLLPGAQGTADMFYRVAASLGGELRVITATPPALPGCEALAESLADFLDGIGLRRAHLLGTSITGHVLQLFAHRHRERVEKLFLANTFSDASVLLARMPPAEVLAGSPAEQVMAGMLAKMMAAPEPEPAHAEFKQAASALMGPKQSAQALLSRLIALRRSGAVPKVPLEPSQVVLIDGDDDTTVLPAMREHLRSMYAGSAHHAIDGGGHYPYILRPAQYVQVLRQELGLRT